MSMPTGCTLGKASTPVAKMIMAILRTITLNRGPAHADASRLGVMGLSSQSAVDCIMRKRPGDPGDGTVVGLGSCRHGAC